MVDASVAKRLVQAIIDNLPEPVPGRRPVHTIGIGVKGEFVASNVARTYCIAEHFKGQTIQVSVRFSNGLGGTPHRLARDFLRDQGRVEGGAGLQHGAGDVEEAIGH